MYKIYTKVHILKLLMRLKVFSTIMEFSLVKSLQLTSGNSFRFASLPTIETKTDEKSLFCSFIFIF